MRVAVISDIHGNLHALEAVLEAIETHEPELVWCLGDLVGYGPRPNRCCTVVEARADVCLVGNHDLVALGRVGVDDFTPEAAASALWTAEVLEEGPRRFLEVLSPSADLAGASLYHASPREPVWEYVLTPEAAVAAFATSAARVILVGHTHVPLAIALSGGGLTGGVAAGGTKISLGEEARWLLNPGSVGQPRDGDPRSAYLLLDLAAGSAAFHRVAYPVERTQKEMRERGLPEVLAARLEQGL